MPSTDSLSPGTHLGRYTLVRPLGFGGMGAVYEAEHADLGKRVAIKVLHPEVARNPEARARFLREGQAAARLQHPHVAVVFDVGQDAGILYLVMELLNGEDLGALLSRERPLPPSRIADIVIPVCVGVSAAHAVGIVHRDLKPENIFLTASPHGVPTPKVLDFGISRLSNPFTKDLTATSLTLGTPHYMSPEQAQAGNSVDARSDVYALGVILYECVTGSRPFEGEDLYPLLHAIVEGNFAPPRTVRADIPEDFEAIILRAMATDLNARFQAATDLAHALLPFAGRATRAVWGQALGHGQTPDRMIPAVPAAITERDRKSTTLGRSAREIAASGGPWRFPTPRLLVISAVVIAALVGGMLFAFPWRHRQPTAVGRPLVASVPSVVVPATAPPVAAPLQVAPPTVPTVTLAPAPLNVNLAPTPSPRPPTPPAHTLRSHPPRRSLQDHSVGTNQAPVVE